MLWKWFDARIRDIASFGYVRGEGFAKVLVDCADGGRNLEIAIADHEHFLHNEVQPVYVAITIKWLGWVANVDSCLTMIS